MLVRLVVCKKWVEFVGEREFASQRQEWELRFMRQRVKRYIPRGEMSAYTHTSTHTLTLTHAHTSTNIHTPSHFGTHTTHIRKHILRVKHSFVHTHKHIHSFQPRHVLIVFIYQARQMLSPSFHFTKANQKHFCIYVTNYFSQFIFLSLSDV